MKSVEKLYSTSSSSSCAILLLVLTSLPLPCWCCPEISALRRTPAPPLDLSLLKLLRGGASIKFDHARLLSHSLPGSQGRKASLSGDIPFVDVHKVRQDPYAGLEPYLGDELVLGAVRGLDYQFAQHRGCCAEPSSHWSGIKAGEGLRE